MEVANNPQTFMNSYLSAMRNTIITLTLGIGIFGFSKTFKNKKSSFHKMLDGAPNFHRIINENITKKYSSTNS